MLGQLGIDADQWVNRVRAVKPDGGFCRAISSEGALLDKAATIGQRWLRGLGIARLLGIRPTAPILPCRGFLDKS